MYTSRQETKAPPPARHGVNIATGMASVHGDLAIPRGAQGVVIFAHGSGNSRFSRCNRRVAGELQRGGLATLLVDLLTPEEAAHGQLTGEFHFGINLLARRVVNAIDWVVRYPATAELSVGLFGASTDAAAALFAAVRRPNEVRAVVSCSGRPDLAESVLSLVETPTLLIVGTSDIDVLWLNRRAAAHLRCETAFEVVPAVTDLFEEPGTLEQTAVRAREWFVEHLHRSALPAAARAGW